MQNRTIESGVQLFSRMNSNSSQVLNGINPKLFPEGGPLANQVIEAVFDEDVDYTDFFIDFIVRAILPSRLHTEFRESQVILLHTDFQINLFKVIKFMEKKLECCNVGSREKKNLIEEALRNLVILNCYTSEQLEITLYNLERIINNCHNPSMVILDNCLSQFWSEKFDNSMLSFNKYCINIVGLLYEKIKDLNVVLMYGRTSNSVVDLKSVSIVTFKMRIVKNLERYLVFVTNYEKNYSFRIYFNVHGCLSFE